jgi:farnesyl diphosphate synthase
VSFEQRLRAVAAEIDNSLGLFITGAERSSVEDAMRYATGGGKKLRGFLVVESCALHEVAEETALLAASAIECIHAYSLVHDDLPSMDDDDLRRGKPTVHKKWNDAVAVLTGDALQSLAFQILGEMDAEDFRKVELMKRLAWASGKDGMVLGQAQDIDAEFSEELLTLEQITELQSNKTGALICWSVEAGAILGGADPAPLRRYANSLGLAFQIADDILDEVGDEAKTGKRLKKDADAGKATFVSLLGVSGAKAKARGLVADAIDALCIYDARADGLRDAARFVISREH